MVFLRVEKDCQTSFQIMIVLEKIWTKL